MNTGATGGEVTEKAMITSLFYFFIFIFIFIFSFLKRVGGGA